MGRQRGYGLSWRIWGKALPPAVLQQVVTKTDGVPLFVEELTKPVLESGLLRESQDHYELPGPLPPLAIPATLHDSPWPGSIAWRRSKPWPNWGPSWGAPSRMS